MPYTAKGKDYAAELVNQIKDVGQELIDKAEEMVGKNLTGITGFHIDIDFPQGDDRLLVPEITCTADIVCENTFRRWEMEVSEGTEDAAERKEAYK